MGTARFCRAIILRLSPLFLLCTFIVAAACTPVPTNGEAAAIITKYFDERGYTVRSIDIGKITPTPLGEKTYMGKKGYTLRITYVTLEAKEDVGQPWHYKKGERLTFTNAIMVIRERNRIEGGWEAEVVSGIPVF
jgi:hypothetical protein